MVNLSLLSWPEEAGAIAPDMLEAGPVRLEVPQPHHFEHWSAVRHGSREALTPFEPTWAEDDTERSGFRRRLRRYTQDRRRGLGAAFFIVRISDGQRVGGCNLNQVQRGVRQCASVGYWSGVEFRRQGYVRSALTAVLAYAFGPLGLQRVEAACLPHNTASLALLASLGFQEEGLAREYLRIDGRWQDHVLLARLAGDAGPA